MVHRVETVMAAIKTAVTGLTTTGVNAYRGRAYALSELTLPAVLVGMGEDDKVAETSQDRIQSRLIVKVEAVATDKADSIETLLNQIRREVNVALGSDLAGEPKLDLPNVVVEIEELGTEEPELTGTGTLVIGRQITVFTVDYGRSRADPQN